MSVCVPEVAKNADLLGRGENDSCAADERCAPCLNPLKNNEPTGVCEIGKAQPACTDTKNTPPPGGPSSPAVACPYTGPPLVDVTTFPACGDGARCVPEALVPPGSAAMLKACATGLFARPRNRSRPAASTSRRRAARSPARMSAASTSTSRRSSCRKLNCRATPAMRASSARRASTRSTARRPARARASAAMLPSSPPRRSRPAATTRAPRARSASPRASCPQAGRQPRDTTHVSGGRRALRPERELQPVFEGPACNAALHHGSYTACASATV